MLAQAQINNIETIVSSNRLRWFGHIVRMPDNRLPSFLLEWKPNYGKRSRGRPRKSWIECVREDATKFLEKDVDLEDIKVLAWDRQQWREMIRHKRVFTGAGHSND